MHIFEALTKFAQARKRFYKQKLLKLGILTFLVTVVGVAGVIALSEVFFSILIILLVLAGALFAYLKICNIELAVFFAQIKTALEKVLDLLRKKKVATKTIC